MNGKEITNKSHRKESSTCIRKYIWIMVAFWTVFVGVLCLWNLHNHKQKILEIARNHLDAAFEKDIVYRRWAADHGGVYVPVSEQTPPSPYLSHIKERDITTPSGRRLTLVNPAYMTRQVQELGTEQYGLKGHITSLNPIRPKNAPDPWETESLKAFEDVATQACSVEQIDGQEYMRMMRPMITEQRCLKCHASQGYKAGDIRGGVSVSIPMEPLWGISQGYTTSVIVGYSGIGVFGLVVIGLGGRYVRIRVTERERSVEDLERMFNMSGYMVCIADINGYFRKISPAFEETLGYTSQELLDKPFLDFVHPEDKTKTLDAIEEKLSKAAQSVTFENRYRCKDGSYKWLAWTSRPVVEEGITFAIAYDITDRKQAADALAESEKKYRLLADNTLDCIWQMDSELRFTYVNPAVFPMFGFTPEEWTGTLLANHCSSEETSKVGAIIAEELQKKETYGTTFEMWLDHKNGTNICCEIISNVIVDENGNPLRFQGTTRDMSERKKTEDKLNKTLTEIERFNKLMIGREGRVIEMKKEVNVLLAELDREPQYKSVLEDAKAVISSDISEKVV